jgi:hypothetical protein
MELALNLVWLILALPAFVVWRRQPASARNSGVVLLGCLLVLLFPIVSVTDDLHPISAEIEECSPLKRALKQSTCVKSPTCGYDNQGTAPPLHVTLFQPENDPFGSVSEYLHILPPQTQGRTADGRAPPTARS